VGLRELRRLEQRKKTSNQYDKKKLPKFSIVVPMKNEEKVAERCLNALLKLDYPKLKKEILVVEDGSTDKTLEICTKYNKRHHNLIKILHRPNSNGKPSALNYAITKSNGEIMAVFDADNVPKTDALLKVAKYFEDPSVVAVQGTTYSLNADENMITKFVSYEEAAYHRTYVQGKDVLGLFVPLTGSCQFLRRRILEEVGGWDEKSLSEDVEMSAKLTERGYTIRYAPDVRSWQEHPSTINQLVRQRTRWFRGYMETALKYGRLVKKFNKRNIDTEVALIGPYLFILFLVGYITAIYSILVPTPVARLFIVTAQLTSLISIATLFIMGLGLIYVKKPRKTASILWLPFIYVYWCLHTFIALHALLQIILRRPKMWIKTTKSGVITNAPNIKDT
jgi:cellulose synthase/poly-beta-1,6-N-acetylglucosamine synthase-like glycosyltransferase